MPNLDATLAELLNTPPRAIAVAVSGGADSFALLHLAMGWAKRHNATLLALTVDHGLRAESAEEARQVAAWCAQQGIPHRTLQWVGEKPRSAIQATARNMRRKLLCAACVEQNIDYLLMGHQADDQAETLLMRLQRGSGLRGLRVMQPFTRHMESGVAILRPLLYHTRAELRQYCTDHHLPFIDDPSNENIEYERVRVRQLVQDLPALGTGVAKTAGRLRRADDTLQKLAQIWLDQNSQLPDTSSLWLPHSFVSDLLPELKIRVLEIILQTRSLSQVETLAEQMHNNDFGGVNLAGMWIRPKTIGKEKGFIFQPEPARKSAAAG